jgi:hypothetical protein
MVPRVEIRASGLRIVVKRGEGGESICRISPVEPEPLITMAPPGALREPATLTISPEI